MVSDGRAFLAEGRGRGLGPDRRDDVRAWLVLAIFVAEDDVLVVAIEIRSCWSAWVSTDGM